MASPAPWDTSNRAVSDLRTDLPTPHLDIVFNRLDGSRRSKDFPLTATLVWKPIQSYRVQFTFGYLTEALRRIACVATPVSSERSHVRCACSLDSRGADRYAGLVSQDWLATPLWLNSPRHVVAAAVAVTNSAGELLLVKSPRRGWELPGGQVELQESIRDAAVREVLEESGIIVELQAFAGVFQNVSRGICSFLFTAKPIGGTLRTSEESLEVGWYPVSTALDLVPRPTMRQRIELTLASSTTPFLIEHTGDPQK